MSLRFERYLDEVSQGLRRVDESRRNEIVAELRSHLTLSMRSGVEELDLGPDEAEHLALRSLGAAKIVAEDLLLQEKGVSGRSAWKLAKWPIGLDFLLVTLLPLALGPFAFAHGTTWLLEVPMTLSPLVPLAFAFSVWKSRRWLLWPMAASISLGLVLSLAIAGSPTYQSLVWASIYPHERYEDAALRSVDKQIEEARGGVAGFLQRQAAHPTDRRLMAPQWVSSTSGYTLPYLPTTVEVRQPKMLAMGLVGDASRGAELWRANGSEMLELLQKEREQLLHPPSLWERASGLLPLGLAMAGTRILELAMVNWLMLALARLRRFRQARRDPHLV